MVYKTAIIGAGIIAQNHLKAIFEMQPLKAAAIADIALERAEEAASQYGIRAYADYKEMIEREKPDIAVITLPHYLHREAAVFCAEAGCHVMLEKPMALSVQECDEMIEAAERNNIQLMVGHTQHYFTANRRAKQLIEQEDLGTLVMINDARHVNYYASSRPQWFLEKEKSGGGIMMNLGSHSIDRIQWITGRRIAKIRSYLSFYGDRGDVEGSGLLLMETADGVPATAAQSGYDGYVKNEIEIIFTKGKLKIDNSKRLWVSRGRELEEAAAPQTEAPFVLQYKELIGAIRGERPLESDGYYGRTVIQAIEALYRSHETGDFVRVGDSPEI